MTNTDLLRQLLRHAGTTLDSRVAGCPEDAFYRLLPEATIGSIAAIYAHAVTNADHYIQQELRGLPPLYERPEWPARLGFTPHLQIDRERAAGLRYDRATFHDYARAVFDEGDAYLGTLAAEGLNRSVEMVVPHRDGDHWGWARQQAPLAFAFADIVFLHIHEHAGEISALRGVQGLTGIPIG